MKRNNGLDLLKTICAFFVICIHSSFPGVMGEICISLARVSVPIFLMITGYYYSRIKEKNGEKKQIVKTFKLFVGANVLYFFWTLIVFCIRGYTLMEYFNYVFSVKSMLKFIIFNELSSQRHLWYIGTILYVLLLIFVFEKKWDRKRLYPIVPVLILGSLVFGNYSLLFFGKVTPNFFSRNFIFVGLPYFLIGDMLNTYRIKLKSKKAIFLSAVFVTTNLIEYFLLDIFNLSARGDIYISTTFLAVCVFLLASQFENKNSNKLNQMLSYIGTNLSSNIYILHPMFITIMEIVMVGMSQYNYLNIVYSYISPFVIMLITTIVSWLYYIVIKEVKTKRGRLQKNNS